MFFVNFLYLCFQTSCKYFVLVPLHGHVSLITTFLVSVSTQEIVLVRHYVSKRVLLQQGHFMHYDEGTAQNLIF